MLRFLKHIFWRRPAAASTLNAEERDAIRAAARAGFRRGDFSRVFRR
jgi:hypothetical protein